MFIQFVDIYMLSSDVPSWVILYNCNLHINHQGKDSEIIIKLLKTTEGINRQKHSILDIKNCHFKGSAKSIHSNAPLFITIKDTVISGCGIAYTAEANNYVYLKLNNVIFKDSHMLSINLTLSSESSVEIVNTSFHNNRSNGVVFMVWNYHEDRCDETLRPNVNMM